MLCTCNESATQKKKRAITQKVNTISFEHTPFAALHLSAGFAEDALPTTTSSSYLLRKAWP